jgi:hypothetical protein
MIDDVGGAFLARLALFTLDLAYTLAIVFCRLPKLLKYGPKFWRIERQMRRRTWKRRMT